VYVSTLSGLPENILPMGPANAAILSIRSNQLLSLGVFGFLPFVPYILPTGSYPGLLV
jgi:hypothetical protein